jgi:ABC-type uncharacterized transport system permease subunit
MLSSVLFVVAHLAAARLIWHIKVKKESESCRWARDFLHDALKSNAAGIHVQITKDIERERKEKRGLLR